MKRGGLGRRRPSNAEILLDSNVFLEVELAGEHAKACKALLRMIERGELRAVITDFHVDSIVVIMERYGAGWEGIYRFLVSLLLYRGLRVHSPGLAGRIRAARYMREYGLDFDDALALQVMEELSIDTIVSYDKHFDSVEWVKRNTPEELLSARSAR